VQPSLDDAREVVGPGRMSTRRKLVQDETQRVVVGASIGVSISKLLGRGVENRTDEAACARKTHRFALQSREAEVHHLDDVVAGDQHVRRLQIAVNDPDRVNRGQPVRDLSADVSAEVLGNTLEVLEEVAERLSLDVLHDDEVAALLVDHE